MLPGWTGYNTLLNSTTIPPLSKLGYLPVIDASPTRMDTVYTILTQSVAIADSLELDSLVLVMDQAITPNHSILCGKMIHSRSDWLFA